ncbi:MAG: HD domain-containing protein [Chloroflexales bacterium]|nr:HD domain-containing protein [Chloroflexales bacterium]
MIWTEQRNVPIYDAQDRLVAIEGVARDITERKNAEEQILGQRRALEQAHLALVESYDITLSGWSQALDLRDHETEGHSARVTDLSVRLARQMGLSDEALEHFRRGALLHDIGKIGIPDAILHKPGPLSEAEWAVMRRHPDYARDLLAPISFLRPALDIPYCHHERWDGTGYPRGLKGDTIPLAARIFAVVDVWDALTNTRPYRAAWSSERVRAHIRTQAGALFDPAVVRAFLALIDDERQAAQRKVA